VYIAENNILITMPGKIGIRIPSHNSHTPSFLDELLKNASTSRKIIVASRIRYRLEQRYHIGIVSTGLSYLAYLGALKKVHKGYKPSRLGKKIGRFLAQERLEEANLAWSELLKRHKLFRVFKRYFSTHNEELWTLDDFSLYLKIRAHAKWNLSGARSRISRLCELFAEKGLIEYQNDHLSPIDLEREESDTFDNSPLTNQPSVMPPAPQMNREVKRISVPGDSWPIRMEIKIEISDKVDPKILNLIFSFLKEIRKSQEDLKIDVT
jgi:hypothetical protein